MKTSTIFIIFFLFLIACSSNGNKKTFGSLDVYYTEGVSEWEAHDVGSYLEIYLGISDRKNVIQLSKANNRYLCKIVMRDGKVSMENTWRGYGESISKEALNGAPVDVDLCDSDFNSLKFLPAER